MINRWLIKLTENNNYKNSVKFPSKFLDEWDNASSWLGWIYGESHWEDTHLYTNKQIREKMIMAMKKEEKRRKNFLESLEE